MFTSVASGPDDLLVPTEDFVSVLLLSDLLVIRRDYVVVGRFKRMS